jgi:hypothetical protein
MDGRLSLLRMDAHLTVHPTQTGANCRSGVCKQGCKQPRLHEIANKSMFPFASQTAGRPIEDLCSPG